MGQANSNSVSRISVWLSYAALLFDLIAVVALFTDGRFADISWILVFYLDIFFVLIGWLAPLISLVLGFIAEQKSAIYLSIISLLAFGAIYFFVRSQLVAF